MAAGRAARGRGASRPARPTTPAAQDRSVARGRGGAAQPGLEPDQRLAGQLRRVRVPGPVRFWPAAVPSWASASRPATSPSGTASRASPARSRCSSGRPGRPGALGRPVQHGAGERVAGQRPQVRDAGDERRVCRPGQHAGRVDDRVGQAQVRGGHRAERVVAGQHPAGRRRPPVRRGGRRAARWRSPGPRPRRSARAPPRWRRSGAGPRPTGRACAAGATPGGSARRRRDRRPRGRSARPATGRVPGPAAPRGRRAPTRTARPAPARSPWVNVGRARPLRAGPAPRARRWRSSCAAPGPAAPAGPGAWPGSPFRSLLHPPLHDHLLVAVLVQERRRAGSSTSLAEARPWPGWPARTAPGSGVGGIADGDVVRAPGCGGGTWLAGWPADSHSKIASSVGRAGPVPAGSRTRPPPPPRAASSACSPAARPRSSACVLGGTQRAEPVPPERVHRRGDGLRPGSASSPPRCPWRAARPGPGSRPGAPGLLARRNDSTSAAPARAVASRPGPSAGRPRCR